ncbi:MAG: oligosaccharide flippase family protein [Candidatus Eisenbacteria bacterium]|nr:oligosaccharide flippase family protein [Candidatus Eisenbacteria bacterium]
MTEPRRGGQPLLSATGATPRRVARVFLIVLVGAACQLLVQTVLARELTREHVGIISLILGALPLLSTITLVGQDSTIVRFLSRGGAERYDARRYLTRVLLSTLPAGALAALAASLYYGLPALAAVSAVTLVACQNGLTLLTSVARAGHRYERAMTGMRLPFVLAALALVVLNALDALTLVTALWTLIGAFAAAFAGFAFTTPSGLAGGGERVPRSVLTEGLLFFGLSLSFSVMMAIDKLIIGRMMGFEDLAVYATVFAVMRGFDFVFYSIGYVLMPRAGTLSRVPLARLNAWIAGIAVAMTAVYLLLGDEAVHFLYEGRYDVGTYLILPFALSGVLKLFYSVPSSVIGGRLPRTALKAFLWYNAAGVVVNVVLDIMLIRTMGLWGAAIATAIAWGIRLAGGYAIMARHRDQLGPRPSNG